MDAMDQGPLPISVVEAFEIAGDFVKMKSSITYNIPIQRKEAPGRIDLRRDLSNCSLQANFRQCGFKEAFLILISCIAPHLVMASETKQMKLNIVIILVDDLGWNDVGYHNENVSTPNIDRLAKAGVELDRFYVNPTCSPTRASLMSGEFATTHGVDSPVQWHSKTGLLHQSPNTASIFKIRRILNTSRRQGHLGSADRD